MTQGSRAGRPRRVGRRRRGAPLLVVAVTALWLLVLSGAARAAEPRPYTDVRTAQPAAPDRVDRSALQPRLGAQGVVDVDPQTGTPRVIARLDGTLTAPSPRDPVALASEYVRANLSALGLTQADYDALESPERSDLPGGVTQVRWRQSVDGIPAAASEVRVNVARDGRILNVLGSPVHALALDTTTPALTAGEAVRSVQDDVDAHRSVVRDSGPAGPTRATTYADGTEASLVVFGGRLAWRVMYKAAPDAVYDVTVDASTGDVLRRANMVKAAAPALVWDRFPGGGLGGTAQSVDLETSGWLAAGASTLNGNNAHAYSDLNDDDVAQGSEEINRTGGTFSYAFTSFPSGGCDAAHLCSWSGSGTTWTTNRLQNGVQAFYLANRFHDHLAAAPIGFGAAAGSFDGVDRLQLHTDDGANTGPDANHVNNANMFTPPDGSSPVMQMYLFRNSSFRNVNGGDDAAILYHEYTHGLSNRLVTDADGFGALNSPQAGAMGEGWGDWYAQDFIVAQFPSLDTGVSGEVSMGAYTDYAGGTSRVRTQPLDCPAVGADPSKCPGRPLPVGSGGYTYGDFGRVAGALEVHSDGEIWAETLWDLRTALGSPKADALVTTGMALLPPEPSFLDARNGIILADQALYGGADVSALWGVFATRGMGFFAAATGGEDASPIESFALPPAADGPKGTIAGRVTDALGGAPLAGMTVGIGGLSSLGSYSATTGSDGRYTIADVPQGTYVKVIATGPGYDSVVSSLSVTGGVTITFDAAIKRNWASSKGGGAITASNGQEFSTIGCGPTAAIDQSLASGWSTNAGSEKFLVARLPSTITVTQFALDPGEVCGDTSVSATAGYRVETSPDGTAWTIAQTGSFGTADRHRLNYVTPTAGATGVRYVRLTLVSPQGGVGAPFMDMAEFGVYGVAPGDTVAPETTIDTGPSGTTIGTNTPSFTFSSNEPGSTFECRLNGPGAATGSFAACTSPRTLGPLADGSYVFAVRARDAAGNLDATPASASFVVDTTGPDTTISGGPSGPINVASAQFSFSSEPLATFECKLDGPGATTGSYAACTSPRTFGSLADGAYTFSVRAKDAVGNFDPTPATRTFTVDTVAPETTIDSGPNLTTIGSNAPTFTFSSDPGSTFECRLNGPGAATGSFAPCTSPRVLGPLADGSYVFAVRATDAAGNVDATPASASFNVDTTPPDTTITAGPSGPTNVASPQFSFAAEPLATFECKLDGPGAATDSFAPCTSPRVLGPLTDGTYTFSVRAKDAVGNVDATPAAHTFTVDTVAPNTAIDSGPTGTITSTTPSFTFSGDAGSTFECKLDGPGAATGTFAPCTSPRPLGPLADGSYAFAVRAVDAAGNADATPASASFVVDATAPDTTITGGPSGPTNVTSPSFSFSSEAGASFECKLDGPLGAPGTYASCTSPRSYGPLVEGMYVFSVRAKDAAGNTDPTPATRSFQVDTRPPDTTITSGTSGTTSASHAEFTWIADEPVVTYTCHLVGGPGFDQDIACPGTSIAVNLPNGTYTFSVFATDAAGNADPTPATQTFTLDFVDPETTIDTGPSGATGSNAPAFTFSSNEAGATFECKLDGPAGAPGTYASCTSPRVLGPLADGGYTFSVRAKDLAGNVDASPATRAFTVDTVAPDTTITERPQAAWKSAATFGFTTNESGSTFECKLDGPGAATGSYAACTSTKTYDGLADGVYTFSVRAVDGAGNADASPASFTFTMDTVRPVTTFTGGPNGLTNVSSPTFSFSSEPGATFQCTLNTATGPWVACSSPYSIGPLADGTYTLSVVATDAALNTELTPATRTFTVDTTAPDTTITAGPTGTIGTNTPSFSFSSSEGLSTFECKLDGPGATPGAYASCTSPRALGPLADGGYTFSVRATDAAGNRDQTPATQAFTVDATPPETTIDTGPSGTVNVRTAAFTFSSSKPGSTFECRLQVPGALYTSCTSPASYAGLADGTYVFSVRATDVFGSTDPSPATQTFTVDATPPETTIASGPTGPITTGSASFAFNSSEGLSSFQCRLTGPGQSPLFAPCTSPATYTNLADGTYTFAVVATDAAGNPDPSAATRSFTVDTVAPQTAIDSGPTGATNAFTFSSSEGLSTFECKLDGPGATTGSYASCASPRALGPLADGTYTFSVRATDAAGNTDATPATQSFTVDTVAPQTAIDSGPTGATNSFAFSSSESGSTFECKLDGPGATTGTFASCSSPHALGPLADGTYTFSVRATDAAGNTDATPATRGFTIDTAAPNTIIDSGPTGPTNAFAFSSSESGSTFECKLDGPGATTGSYASCTSPRALGTLADGTYTFSVRATDAAGNTDASPATRSFTIDTVAPNTLIDSGPTGPTNAFAFSSSEAGSTFECKLDGPGSATGTYASCGSPRALGALADGSYTFSVRATDAAGNTDASAATRSFTIDTVAPNTLIDSGPTGATNSFAFSSSEAGSTFECKLDGPGSATGTYALCSSPRALGALADGSYTFSVRATDAAGNTDASPATRSFTIDTVAPDTSINSGPLGLTRDNAPQFTFSGTETGATFECRLDGPGAATGSYALCTSPRALGTFPDGSYTFSVRATDAAGNTDQTPATQSFTIDTVAPQTTIDTGPTGATNAFTFSSSETGSTFECKLDGPGATTGSYALCTSPRALGTLADGSYTFSVRATDAAGNTDASPATRGFTIDTVAPNTIIDSGPTGATNSFAFSSSEAGSTFECKLDGPGAATGSYASCTSPRALGTLADGTYTFSVRATDAAGNTDASPATRSFTIDTVAPNTIIDSGPTGATNSFAFSSSEAGSTFECKLDGPGAATGSYASCTSPRALGTLADGTYTFSVRATDAAGNTDATPATRSFTIDTVAPNTIIDTGPTGASNSFAFSSTESGSTFECKLDGPGATTGSYALCSSPRALGVLADGTYTFSVRATDAAGNTDASPATRSFTVDSAAPNTIIDSGPTGASNSFAFSSSESGSTFECKLDGPGATTGSYATCTSPRALGALADGTYTFSVRATDGAGNTDPTPATRSFTIDTAAPNTIIDSGPTGATNSFAFSSSESGSTFECKLDGPGAATGSYATCTSPRALGVLADGTYTFSVRATDAAGNTDASPATRSFTVDSVAPNTIIDSGPTGATNSFAFSSSESGSTFECKLDGLGAATGSYATCTSPRALGTLADGTYTFSVRATDGAGNTDPTPATRSFTIDTVAPNTIIDTGPTGASNSFAFSSTESGSTFECKLDGPGATTGSYALCSSPRALGVLADGTYTFSVRATDGAGNTDASPATRSFTVDTVAPNTIIDSGPTGASNSFAFSSTEAGSTFECKLDGPGAATGSYATCTSPRALGTLADGTYTFSVRATDGAGNTDATPATRSFTVDTVAPNTIIDSGPTGATNSFAFSSSESGSTFECKLDGPGAATGSYATCTSPRALGTLADGTYTFSVRATDGAGNTDATPATRSFTVDTVAPNTIIDSGPTGATNSFAFSSSEAGSTFECKLDGPGATTGSYASCSSPRALGVLADGTYTFSVRATDAAGNTDASPATRSFTVDTVAPNTIIDSGPTGATNSFAFSSTEAGSTFECKLDGPGAATGSYASCSSPRALGALADGTYTFSVRATDGAGNTDATPATRSFTIDTTAPNTTVTGPSGTVHVNQLQFTLESTEAGSTFECRLDGPGSATGSFAPCTSPLNLGPLAEGAYALAVRATDPAGNTDATPAIQSFVVDVVKPDTSIVSGPSGPTTVTSPAFAFTATEADVTFECKLDGPGAATGSFAPCTSPRTLGPLADGAYTFSVRATDVVGDSDPTPATQSFTVDTTPPDTFIDSGPGPQVHAGALTFAVRAGEPGTIACALDGGTYGSCSAPLRAEDLALGAHVFRARATDTAGNADPTPAEYPFTVTNAAPVATLDLDTAGGPAPLTVHATVGGSDADGDALTYTLQFGDGQQVTGGLPAAPIEHRYDTSGDYTVRLEVRDARTGTAVTRTVTVTTTQPAPTLALTLGPPAAGLGVFEPGVTRDYTTSLSAVASSPARATLSISDATAVATGHLVNGTFALKQALQARASSAAATGGPFMPVHEDNSLLALLHYGQSIANDAVTIEFKQPVAATDPLATGAYTKTFTFTLSVDGP